MRGAYNLPFVRELKLSALFSNPPRGRGPFRFEVITNMSSPSAANTAGDRLSGGGDFGACAFQCAFTFASIPLTAFSKAAIRRTRSAFACSQRSAPNFFNSCSL